MQTRDWPSPSSKTCFRLTPRAVSIHTVTFRKILSKRGILRHKFKLFSFHAVDGFFSAVRDIPLLREIFAASAEAKHEVAAELIVFVGGHLVTKFLVEAEDSFEKV